MYRVPLAGAHKAIDALKASLRFNRSVRQFVAGGGSLSTQLPPSPPLDEWRRLDYSTTVTRLYQVFESLVHDCVNEWLSDLCQLVPFNELPADVTRTYRNGVGYLLQNLDGRRYEDLSLAHLIRDYQNALAAKSGYGLVAEAFLLHDRNLRVEELQSILRGCGVTTNLAEWLKNHRISKQDHLQLLGHPSVDKCLSAFIDLRNEASHATKKVTELLGEDALLAYADFIRGLCEALVEALTVSALKWHEQHGQWSKVGKINFVKNDDRRVCIAPIENCKVTVGSELYLVGPNFCTRALIENIQLDGNPVNEHTVGANAQELGFRLDIEVFKNTFVYVRSQVPTAPETKPIQPESIDLGTDETPADAAEGSGTTEEEPA